MGNIVAMRPVEKADRGGSEAEGWTPEQLARLRELEARIARMERETQRALDLCPVAARIRQRLQEREQCRHEDDD